jgi:hypothetical protein
MPYNALASPALAAGSSGSTGVTATVAVFCLVAAGLLWFVGGHFPRVTLLLVITASAGLAGTSIGKDIHNAVDNLIGQADTASTNLIGGAVGGFLGLILAYVIYIHWDRRQITYLTLASAFLLPMVAAATPGTGGRVLIWALGLITQLCTAAAHLIGVH